MNLNKKLSKKAESVVSFIMVLIFFVFTFFMITIQFNSYTERYSSSPFSDAITGEFSNSIINSASKAIGNERYDSFDKRLDVLLYEVGGDSTIIIQSVPNACGTGDAVACVLLMDANRIQVDELTAFESDDYIKGLLAHELAHVVTNKLSLIESWKYLLPFGGDHEYVADCMAISNVGYTVSSYGFTCSAQQIKVADDIWLWYYSLK